MNRYIRRSAEGVLLVLVLGALAACSTIKVNTLPPPPPTAKLRVYVEAFSLGPAQRWAVPHDKFVENQVRGTERVLKRTGIYEVVSSQDVRAAIGDQILSYDSMRNFDWAQARQIGSALHADCRNPGQKQYRHR
jgi:hypothetical protein